LTPTSITLAAATPTKFTAKLHNPSHHLPEHY
jgi:hypothetical protein